MRVQIWSCHYAPEPIGIGPVVAIVARSLQMRGHEVEVIAAHPHYPEPRWGARLRAYREVRDGIRVLRLPVWLGRRSTAQRVRLDASLVAALSLWAPLTGSADAVVAVSPSFAGLAPLRANVRARRRPWVLWLQDILPDGALATGMLNDGPITRAAKRFELSSYRSAAEVVVISQSFADNLAAKGVPPQKMTRIYNPATNGIAREPRNSENGDGMTVLTMGNIGHTQNLEQVTRLFETSNDLERLGARLRIVGEGGAAEDVRRAATTDRVSLPGLVSPAELDRELDATTVALVSQRYDGFDFNVPSKLMSFMGRGIPVVAAVRQDSEVARIVRDSGGGWVVSDPDGAGLGPALAEALRDPAERSRRGAAALRFAQDNFSPEGAAEAFEAVLMRQLGGGS